MAQSKMMLECLADVSYYKRISIIALVLSCNFFQKFAEQICIQLHLPLHVTELVMLLV